MVYLSDSQITDAGLVHLAEMAKLETLQHPGYRCERCEVLYRPLVAPDKMGDA